MPHSRVVHCKHEPYDVYIGRGSKWGNPFVVGRNGTREEVIEKYRVHLHASRDLMDSLYELIGKRLGCYCAPQACHGDLLASMADQLENDLFGDKLDPGFLSEMVQKGYDR